MEPIAVPDTSTAETTLRTIVAAFNREDFNTILEVCSDDIILIFAGQHALRGKAQLLAYFSESLESSGPRRMKIEITDHSVRSDAAWILTNFELSAGNSNERIRGRSLTIYEFEQERGWFLRSEMVDQILAG